LNDVCGKSCEALVLEAFSGSGFFFADFLETCGKKNLYD
jgi:hypothetical protein